MYKPQNNDMKLRIHYLISVLTAFILFATLAKVAAADSLYVHSPQIPILLDRRDNILCEIRLNANSGEIFDGVTVTFDPSSATGDIEALRLFYAGTEARDRKGLYFRPVNYIPRDIPARTLEAHPSYSVLQSEVLNPAAKTTLVSGQSMPEGVNYFWVSIQMKPSASLDTRISAAVSEIRIDGNAVPIQSYAPAEARRMGIGVRHAGDH